MNILYSEQSQRTRSAELLVVVFVILLVGAMVFTTYRSFAQGHILLSEYFIEIMALIVIVKQAVSRYTYILTDSEFIIKEKSFFRKRTFSVKYDDIDGIYAYNRDIVINIENALPLMIDRFGSWYIPLLKGKRFNMAVLC